MSFYQTVETVSVRDNQLTINDPCNCRNLLPLELEQLTSLNVFKRQFLKVNLSKCLIGSAFGSCFFVIYGLSFIVSALRQRYF